MSLRPSPKIIGGTLAAVIAAAMAFVRPWEGSEPVGYSDVVGVTTACVGHTGPEVVLGKRYDEYQCEKWFKKDIQIATEGVLSCVSRERLTVNQATAFVSLAFNIGVDAFCGSTVARKANAGDRAGSCKAILMWVYAGGKRVQGLVNRRNAEYRLCMRA